MSKLLTIERKRIDPNRLYGVMVSQSDVLMLLHKDDDFIFDGYTVLRRKDITKSFSSEPNDYCTKLMKKEGVWEAVPQSIKKLPLNSWATLLNCFIGKVVILESEHKDKDDDFYIGPIEKITKTSVVIRWFDAVGEWGECDSVPFSKITSMRFGDRYSTTYAKYLKK